MRLDSVHQLRQVDVLDIPVMSSEVKVVDCARDLRVVIDSQVDMLTSFGTVYSQSRTPPNVSLPALNDANISHQVSPTLY